MTDNEQIKDLGYQPCSMCNGEGDCSFCDNTRKVRTYLVHRKAVVAPIDPTLIATGEPTLSTEEADWNALDEGKAAYSEDKNPEDNPYPVGSYKHIWWAKGWKRAEANDPLRVSEEDEDPFADNEDEE